MRTRSFPCTFAVGSCAKGDALYELAFRTARAFERFKGIYRTYLDEVAGARS
jgi:hypothetical protein